MPLIHSLIDVFLMSIFTFNGPFYIQKPYYTSHKLTVIYNIAPLNLKLYSNFIEYLIVYRYLLPCIQNIFLLQIFVILKNRLDINCIHNLYLSY